MSGWGYQDNMIAKYHMLDGASVTVIANKYVYDKEGNYVRTDASTEYDENGVKIVRLDQIGDKQLKGPAERVHYKGLYECLTDEKPDIIFLHNPQIMDTEDIVRYIKDIKTGKNINCVDGKPGVIRLYVDSHSDYSNSGRNFLSKHILHGIFWRNKIRKLIPYTEKFYGVLPARVDFMLDRYHTPKDRTELLVMGMDDEKAEEAASPEVRSRIRQELGISENDFLIISGGKIDHSKTQTLLLMRAVEKISKELDTDKIRLVVFGSVVDDMKDEFDSIIEETNKNRKIIDYIGWLSADGTYPYFASSDLAVFPGRHSVMWEQVAGQGIPMVVKFWEGTTHVDLGGNCKFLYKDSVEEIEEVIKVLPIIIERLREISPFHKNLEK